MRFHRGFARALSMSAIAVAGLLSATSLAGAADKITIMVGGYEKQIYLPAKLAEALVGAGYATSKVNADAYPRVKHAACAV